MPTDDQLQQVIPGWAAKPWRDLQPAVRDVFRTHGRIGTDLSLDGVSIDPDGLAGWGAYGAVFRGRTPGGQPVAVKVFGVGANACEADLQSIVREVAAGMAVASPHIARYDRLAVLAPPTPGTAPAYLLFREYIPGAPLRYETLAAKPDEARAVFWCLAAGLRDIHEYRQLVHRDVKAQNAVGSGSVAKWVDLGQVRLGGASAGPVLSRRRVYTDPPEVWSGYRFDESLWDRPGDVYALGATLLYLATGRELADRGWTPADRQCMDASPLNCGGVLTTLLPRMLDADRATRPPMKVVADKLR